MRLVERLKSLGAADDLLEEVRTLQRDKDRFRLALETIANSLNVLGSANTVTRALQLSSKHSKLQEAARVLCTTQPRLVRQDEVAFCGVGFVCDSCLAHSEYRLRVKHKSDCVLQALLLASFEQ